MGRARQRKRQRRLQSSAAGNRPPAPLRTNGPLARLFDARTFGLGVLGLGLLVAVAYLPTLSNGFVWDDRAFTEAAPVREAAGIWRIWFAPSDIKGEGHYWPLTYTTFWLEHRLWGFWAPGYHGINMLLHFVNVVLIWRLLARLNALPVWGAWTAAALFAVHPVHVEAVAWVIGRKDLLATLFYLGAALAWLRSLDAAAARRRRWHLLALALFAASLLCKSIGITLPAALLVHGWWRHGRLTASDAWRTAPFFAVAAAVAAADFVYYEEIIQVDFVFVERLLIAAQAFWFYVGNLLWPANLLPVYPHWPVDLADAMAWAYVLGTLATVPALWFLRTRIGRGALAATLFFALTLSPTLGIVPYGYMQFSFVANRYQYLADVGALALLVGAAAAAINSLGKASRWPATAAAGARSLLVSTLLLALGAATWQQAGVYRDEISFFTHVIEGNPKARDAHLNLGLALFNSGEQEKGLAAVRTSLAQRPDSMKGQYNAGWLLYQLGQWDEALAHYQRALAINANNGVVQYATGLVLAEMGRDEAAAQHYRRTLEVDPQHLPAHLSLASLLANSDADAAARHAHQALAIKPNHAGAALTLAGIEFNRQRYQASLDFFLAVTEQQRDNARAWSGAGAALYHLGRPAEALRHVDHALALDPSLAEAHNNRAGIAEAAARAAGAGNQ